MHANDVPLHGLTQDEVRARREAGRTNTMPRGPMAAWPIFCAATL